MNVARPHHYVPALVGLLVLLWGSVGLNRIGLGLILPNIRSEFGIDNLQASLLLAGTSITWAFASWVAAGSPTISAVGSCCCRRWRSSAS